MELDKLQYIDRLDNKLSVTGLLSCQTHNDVQKQHVVITTLIKI